MYRNIALLVAAVALAGAAISCQDKSSSSSSSSTPEMTKYDDRVIDQKTTSMTATVEKVNHDTRYVTVRGPQGNQTTFKAGPEVRNLKQVEPGDKVTVSYYESMAAHIRRPGEAASNEEQVDAMRAPEGEKPGIAGRRKVTTTARIEAIDMSTPSLTMRTKDGMETTVKVRDRNRLKEVQVGEEIVITYTEGTAISVVPAD